MTVVEQHNGVGTEQQQVEQRLQKAWQVLEQAGKVTTDSHGFAAIQSTPPLNRTSIAPERWQPNIFKRWWNRNPRPAAVPSQVSVSSDKKGTPWKIRASLRRTILLILLAIQTTFATMLMAEVLPYHGEKALEVFILVLFALLFCWVSSGFWTALMGFYQLMKGRDRFSISATVADGQEIDGREKTAIVMPICNEDVPRVFAGLKATIESVQAAGVLQHFDFFILSDSNDPAIILQEQQAWMQLTTENGWTGQVFYRRRVRRVKRKSGNLDDFCRRWGNNYTYMLVLDADSVMTGDCLKRLMVLMQANPQAGIIQTAPVATGMRTLYARMQQFATRVYGPLFTAGLHFWQLGESHYWGHNAMIRLKPFMEHCILAPLEGSGALAGSVLSHDFVEAALMRRAGYGVWIAYDLPGSYEELPPNLLDELQRDQRWCHGNLMNFRLFLLNGLHPVHRAVFLTGVMSYLSAPLWFLFLLSSTALLAVHTLYPPVYFTQHHQLLPIWPEWNPGVAVQLFTTTICLLFLPKVLSVVRIMLQESKGFGGNFKLLLSMLMEMLFSMLLAPIRMVFHTRFILATIFGGSAGWKSPARDNDQTPWLEAIRRHIGQLILGVVWVAIVYWLNPGFIWWMIPILAAFFCAIPLSVYSSSLKIGEALYEQRFLRIPEESMPPQELRNTKIAHRKLQTQAWNQMEYLADSPVLQEITLAMVPLRHRQSTSTQKVSLTEESLPSSGLKSLNHVHYFLKYVLRRPSSQ